MHGMLNKITAIQKGLETLHTTTPTQAVPSQVTPTQDAAPVGCQEQVRDISWERGVLGLHGEGMRCTLWAIEGEVIEVS
jgi:hypothetical protein